MLRHLSWSILSVLARAISGFVIFIALAREVTVEQFGEITYFFTISVIVGLLLDYGFTLKLSRDAVQSDEATLSRLVTESAVLKTTNLAIVLVFVFLLPLDVEVKALLVIFVLSQYFHFMGGIFLAILRARDLFADEARIILTANIVCIAVFFLLVYREGFAFWAFPLALLGGKILYFLPGVSRVAALFDLGSLTWHSYRKQFITLFPFFAHAGLGYVYLNIDTVMLKLYVTFTEIGIYQAAMKVILGTTFVAEALGNVLMPKLIKHGFGSGGTVVRSYHAKTASWTAGAGIAFSLLAIILLMNTGWLFGESYVLPFTLVVALTAVVFLRYIGVYFGLILTIVGDQKARAFGGAAALVASMTCLVTLLPKYGIVGASVSALVAHVVIATIYISVAMRYLRTSNSRGDWV